MAVIHLTHVVFYENDKKLAINSNINLSELS